MQYFNRKAPISSLYIHWPFCPYKCHFCPFVALAGHDSFMPRYHAALVKEIDAFSKMQELSAPIETIFFGGGTPSTYPAELLLDMSAILKDRFNFSPTIEISLEVNPGTVDRQKLQLWKEIGVNRLSIGVQSLNNEVLRKLNRHQQAEQVRTLIKEAPEYIENISIDLIIGLPGVSADEWRALLAEIVQWPITHVSTYFLTVHEDTPLYFGVKQQKIVLPTDEHMVDLYHETRQYLAVHGFDQYEVSSFARDGFECKHNKTYWQRNAFKGFGLGAYSFDGDARLQNEKNLLKYLEFVEAGSEQYIFYERLTDHQHWLERLMLGLRQIKGVSLSQVVEPLNPTQIQEFMSHVDRLVQTDFLKKEHDRLVVAPAGLAVVNELIVKLACI